MEPAFALDLREFRRELNATRYENAAELQRRIWSCEENPPIVKHRDIPLLPWPRLSVPPAPGPFLFVSGTARSGTTALGKLLNAHAQVAIYIELYHFACGYTPQMFSTEAIGYLQQRGLLPDPLPAQSLAAFRKAVVNEPPVRFLGDKRPEFLRTAQLTLEHFRSSHVTVVHIRRPVRDVAWSYMKRVENGTFSHDRDYKRAVDDCNFNNRKLLELAQQSPANLTLLLVDYHQFWQSQQCADQLFSRLSLADHLIDRQAVANLYKVYRQRISTKSRELPAEMEAHIHAQFDHAADDAVRDMARGGPLAVLSA
ncbi:MAG: sulfotransferase [Cyanobacteria bacterium J06638_7]